MAPESLNKPAIAVVGTLIFLLMVAGSVPNLLRSKISAQKSHLYGMAAGAAQAAEGEPKTVQTGTLMLTVNNPAEVSDRIRKLAERLGGFLVDSEATGNGSASSASLSIRIPAARFEEAQAEIRKLALRVEIARFSAKDVTKEYVDRAARIRNSKAQEAQYLAILKRANTIKETLDVVAKLNEVRGEIEQQQAEFDTLTKEVETVALAISLQGDEQAQVFGLHWRPLYQLKHAAGEGLDSIGDYASTMATVVFYLPATVLWLGTILLGAALGWRILKWVGRTFFVLKAKPTTA
jgi:Domain of unknown function (DUF4349)